MWLLKKCMNVLALILSDIVNVSLSTGTMASAIKNALNTPLVKVKPLLDPNQPEELQTSL